ncbi:larval cuticle protein 16/17-like [Spodoptera litura]|uniref:Larval cuticle protein 16/17-like n=1 Tax=Spodoptera litura TaxID=69820 RepID=A0A9J7DT20_SPOLT|nr:larval cuticle protein 16/17-like [Spodoptera litura]
MKSIILIAVAFLAIAAAAPVEKEPPKVVYYVFEKEPEGSYVFKYETDDGTKREETGVVRETLDEDNKLQRVVVVSGSYTFVNNEGELDTIKYFADESGYHADGKSIPKVPARR